MHKSKGPRISKMILERRTKSGNKYSLISRLTLNYGNLKTGWCCHKQANKSMGQNRDRAPSRAAVKRALAVRHGGMIQVQLKHLHIPPPHPRPRQHEPFHPEAKGSNSTPPCLLYLKSPGSQGLDFLVPLTRCWS